MHGWTHNIMSGYCRHTIMLIYRMHVETSGCQTGMTKFLSTVSTRHKYYEILEFRLFYFTFMLLNAIKIMKQLCIFKCMGKIFNSNETFIIKGISTFACTLWQPRMWNIPVVCIATWPGMLAGFTWLSSYWCSYTSIL